YLHLIALDGANGLFLTSIRVKLRAGSAMSSGRREAHASKSGFAKGLARAIGVSTNSASTKVTMTPKGPASFQSEFPKPTPAHFDAIDAVRLRRTHALITPIRGRYALIGLSA